MWLSQNEGAKFWLAVLTELQNRGVKDIFIACVDGLTGFPEAIESVLTRDAGAALHGAYGQKFAALRLAQAHAKRVATDLKAIYSSATQEEAELNLELFAEQWDGLYPSIVPRRGARSGRA